MPNRFQIRRPRFGALLLGVVIVAIATLLGASGAEAVQESQTGLFNPVVPSRILDTRPGFSSEGNPADGVDEPLGAAQTRAVQVADLADAGIPAQVTAVAIHVTSVGPTANSFLTVWPSGARPNVGSKNFGITAGGPFGYAGLTNDLLIVPVGPDGTVQVYNDAGSVDLVIDIVGYFMPLEPAFVLECDVGVLVNDYCEIREPAARSCPDGFTADPALGGLCARFEPADELPNTCPEGSRGVPGDCYIVVARGPGTVLCDEGTPEGTVCVIVGDPPTDGPPPNCAAGFGRIGDQCIRYENATVIPADCPDDSAEDEAGDCRKPVMDQPGGFACADPQAALNGSSCVFTAPFVFGPCQVGVLVGSECVFFAEPDEVINDVEPVGDNFNPVVPSRILDTRPGFASAGNPADGVDVALGAGQTRVVQVADLADAGVPAGVSAVAIHVTSVGPTADSFLTVWSGGDRPNVASKNFGVTAGGPFGYAGLTNDLLIVPVGPSGTVQVYNDAGSVDLVIDIVGYFTPIPTQ